MRTADVLRTALGGVAVLALATGCGSNVDGAAPTTGATESRGDVQVFNPCSQLSDEALRAIGLDPLAKSVTTDPPQGPSAWRICGWYPPEHKYKVDVMSSSHTLAETRANNKIAILREITIGARNGVVSRDKSDTQGDSCYASFPAEQGMFEIAVGWESEARKPDLCELAVKHAQALEPILPK
ncbi:DUF3558 domain-containing protein [Nocardia sp. NBC_01730]|uniref:DUF3558 domain-containing protein n=1 Tax=Nocardia sp. NBC_01730 TaxID=2975998 RepID=UPI002E117244|nr:DUF3558 domain-containing protein [Nocardia sp. NBC_01730]